MHKERNLEVLTLRETGMCLAEIGREFGISKERASKICRKIKCDQERYDRWPWLRQLSVSSQNRLRTYFRGTEVFDHPELIAKEGKVAISMIQRIGSGSVAEIGAALQNLGLIDDVDDW